MGRQTVVLTQLYRLVIQGANHTGLSVNEIQSLWLCGMLGSECGPGGKKGKSERRKEGEASWPFLWSAPYLTKEQTLPGKQKNPSISLDRVSKVFERC